VLYEKYFEAAHWYRDVEKIEALAQVEATKAGLSAMDALHLAAAQLSRADEFITTEEPRKSIYRSSLVRVIYLFK
jgi:predicted nucleic acid-binding protein